MPGLSRAALAQELVPIVRRAAATCLAYFEEGFNVRTKADASLVTDADIEVERALIDALYALDPTVPVVSEEAVSQGLVPWRGGAYGPPRYWLVDPIDGTRSFIAREPSFCTNVALIEGGRAVLGLIHAPVSGMSWTGAGPGTATLILPDGKTRRIKARAADPQGMVVISSRDHGDREALQQYLAQYRVAQHLETGSAIKFCKLAEGEADLYPRFGATSEWDTAAGQAILEAAGGRVTTVEGKAIGYGKADFANPFFVAKGAW